MAKLTWKQVTQFPKYEVCKETQQIRKIGKTRVLSQRMDQYGYLRINLDIDNGKFKTRRVHQVVAWAYVDGYRKGLTVNHKNGIKTDNRPENLEWVSLSDNLKHGWETGLYKDFIYDPENDTSRYPLELTNSFGKTHANSIREAARIIGCAHSTISSRLRKSKDGTCEVNGYRIRKIKNI